MTVETKLEMIDGCEVQSIKHEGCVYIVSAKKRLAAVDGNQFQLTDKDVNYLYKKYLKDELGY